MLCTPNLRLFNLRIISFFNPKMLLGMKAYNPQRGDNIKIFEQKEHRCFRIGLTPLVHFIITIRHSCCKDSVTTIYLLCR